MLVVMMGVTRMMALLRLWRLTAAAAVLSSHPAVSGPECHLLHISVWRRAMIMVVVGGVGGGRGGDSCGCHTTFSIATTEIRRFALSYAMAPSFCVTIVFTVVAACGHRIGGRRTTLIRVGLTGHQISMRERERVACVCEIL